MTRVAVALGLAATVLAGCATRSQPLPVPDEVSGPVRELVGGLGGQPSFTAETCANLPVDAPTDGARRVRSEARLAGVDVNRLRAAGIAHGWQPYPVEGGDLALRRVLGDGAPMTLTARAEGGDLRVRVSVEYRCTTPSGFDYGRVGALPEVLPDQRAALDRAKAGVGVALRKVSTAFGVTASLGQAQVETCPTGVREVFQVTGGTATDPAATTDTIAARLAEALGTAWSQERTPASGPGRKGVAVTAPDGTNLRVDLTDRPVGVVIQLAATPCVPPAG